MSTSEIRYTPKDFDSGEEVRWCPGCGDYAILNAVRTAFSQLGIPREKFVIVSGIGCSSRFPYYMNVYGFHGIHGRAPAIATGIKMANPDLSVWVATGDGDGLAIGGNHFMHILRRNVDVKILLFDNRIYGLTKGQYSPTSVKGQITKSSPFGVVERPADPVMWALSAGATFIARTIDTNIKHMVDILKMAAEHKGAAFVHIYQNCVIFNDGAFDEFGSKEVRSDRTIDLQHGKKMIFGKNLDKGIKIENGKPKIVSAEEADIYDAEDIYLNFAMALMHYPQFPEPIGIIRKVSYPTFEELTMKQIEMAREKMKEDLQKVFETEEAWEVQ